MLEPLIFQLKLHYPSWTVRTFCDNLDITFMKRSIFVTGIAGSGKSSICKKLNILGYEVYDIEEPKGMFRKMVSTLVFDTIFNQEIRVDTYFPITR